MFGDLTPQQKISGNKAQQPRVTWLSFKFSPTNRWNPGLPRAVLMHFCPYFGHTYCLELWSCIWANKFCQYQSLKLIAVILPPEKWVAKGEVFLFFFGKNLIFSGGKLLVSGRKNQQKLLELGEASLKRWHFGHFNFGGLKFSVYQNHVVFSAKESSGDGFPPMAENGSLQIRWGLRLGFPL